MKSRHPLRAMAAIGLGIISISLVACSSTTKSAEAPTSLKSGEVATITFLHRMPDKKGAKTINQLVDEFNKSHPQIKVTPETMQGSANESYAKINSIVEAGTDVPCIAQIGTDRVADMLSTLTDVSQYTNKYKDHYLPAFYAKGQVGNGVYGLPMGASPVVLYYRADLFDKYGLKVPTTWDEYKAVAKQIREKTNKKSYLGVFETDETMTLNALMTSEGANWYSYNPDKQSWKVAIDSPESQKVADFWQGLVDDDLVVPTQRYGQDFNKFLSDGTILSSIGGAWEAPLIADAAPSGAGKWKVAQLPHFDAGTTTVGQNGGSLAAVLKGCQYPAQAVEFMDWWSTNVDGLTGLGLLPAAKVDAIETPQQLKAYYSGQDYYAEFIKANANAPQVTWAPQISETVRVMGDDLGKVGKGTTIAQVLKNSQAASIKSLEDVGITVEK